MDHTVLPANNTPCLPFRVILLANKQNANTGQNISGYAMVVHGRHKTPKIQVLGVTQPPGVVQPLHSRGHN